MATPTRVFAKNMYQSCVGLLRITNASNLALCSHDNLTHCCTGLFAAGPTSNRAAFVATSVLIPVGVIIIIIAASAVFIWRRRLRHVKGSLESRRSSSIDPADSAQGTSLQMTHANWIESKSLSELPSLSSHGSYPKLAAAHRESHIGGEDCLVKLPPAWIDAVPFSDWEIDVADVVIGLRPDGRKWELGAGAFSVVSLLL